jgi:cell division protease FtsH
MTDHEVLANALDAGLADELFSPGGTADRDEARSASALGPAVTLAWLMLEAATDASPGFLPAARAPGAVVIVEVSDALWGEEVAAAWRLMTEKASRNPDNPPNQPIPTAEAPEVMEALSGAGRGRHPLEILALKKEGKSEKPALNEFRAPLRWGRAIHVITADAASLLPAEVVASADARLVIPRPSTEQLAAMVRKLFDGFDGELPALPEALMASLQPSDLILAMRPAQSADSYLERLERIMRARQRPEPPGLETLVGLGEADAWGRQVAADLCAYRTGLLPWRDIDRGAVLVGPPGCGKTSFARALAASAGVAFVAASLQQWQGDRDGHLGSTLAAMRNSFDEARRRAPSVLLVDELDSLSSRAREMGSHRSYHLQVINAFLEQLDGATGREGVLVIGATNDATNIDPAILRSGRLERVIAIPLPDRDALAEILRRQLRGTLPDADLRPLADAASGRGATGADIEAWCRGARRAARASGRQLLVEDLTAEIGEPPPPPTEEQRRRVAIHEAGHTIAYLACGLGVFQAAVLDNGGRFQGVTLTDMRQLGLPIVTRRVLRRHLRALLAGRAAEIELLGDVSTGAGGPASSDLALATRLALNAVATWGLDEHDHAVIWRGVEVARDPDGLIARDSELRERVGAVLGECMSDARRLVRRMRGAVEEIAHALLERGRLDAPGAMEIVDRHFPRPTRDGGQAQS